MKIVGVNMDNLDNNLDMVTKGQQQQQQPRTFQEDVANIRTLGPKVPKLG